MYTGFSFIHMWGRHCLLLNLCSTSFNKPRLYWIKLQQYLAWSNTLWQAVSSILSHFSTSDWYHLSSLQIAFYKLQFRRDPAVCSASTRRTHQTGYHWKYLVKLPRNQKNVNSLTWLAPFQNLWGFTGDWTLLKTLDLTRLERNFAVTFDSRVVIDCNTAGRCGNLRTDRVIKSPLREYNLSAQTSHQLPN